MSTSSNGIAELAVTTDSTGTVSVTLKLPLVCALGIISHIDRAVGAVTETHMGAPTSSSDIAARQLLTPFLTSLSKMLGIAFQSREVSLTAHFDPESVRGDYAAVAWYSNRIQEANAHGKD